MIDFRYHLVSLIAVFMALATGILVGSSLLNQNLLDSQRSTIASQATEKENLRRDLATARNEVIYRDDYLTALTAQLLAGKLAGRRIVLVTMPGAAGKDADNLDRALTAAGAKVTGRVGVSEDFFASSEDPRETAVKGEARDEIVRKYSIPELRGQDADVQLAGALMTRGPADPVGAPAKELLNKLDGGGFINKGSVADRADLAVLLVGPPPAEALGATDRTRRGVVGLAAAIDAAGVGAVVAGPSDAAVGGALDGIRKAAATKAVSTVDTVDTVFGQVTTVYALMEQIAGGAGHYGSAADADSPFPDPSKPVGKK